jgi:hypothetical protein
MYMQNYTEQHVIHTAASGRQNNRSQFFSARRDQLLVLPGEALLYSARSTIVLLVHDIPMAPFGFIYKIQPNKKAKEIRVERGVRNIP